MVAALLAVLLANPNFELDTPEGWKVETKTKGNLLMTKAGALVQLRAVPNRHKDLASLAKWWKPSMETHVDPKAVVKRSSSKTTLGGERALAHDIELKGARVTWIVARRGSVAYGLYLHRHGDALESEIAAIRKSVKLTAKVDVPAPKPTATTGPKPPKREIVEIAHWRLKCVKPAGMTRPKTFDKAERANSVVARFDLVAKQSVLMIRVYAHRTKMDVKKQADVRIREFAGRYRKLGRTVTDTKFKLPLARAMIHVRLTALDGIKKVEDWYFAQCRNGCSYEIQIYRSGPKDFAKVAGEFLALFQPLPKKK